MLNCNLEIIQNNACGSKISITLFYFLLYHNFLCFEFHFNLMELPIILMTNNTFKDEMINFNSK